jgi:hypothetical protein
VSALFLFSMLVPTYPLMLEQGIQDVPTAFYTEVSVKSLAPFGFTGDEVFVDLVIDEQGRVVDYTLPHLPAGQNAALRRAIENNLLFAQFTPATTFGQPTAGRIRLSFRRSQIDVKG